MGKRIYFQQSEQAYDAAIRLICSLDSAFQADLLQDAPERRYDVRVTLYQFDIILQAILLQIALSDGVFHRLERKLIRRITQYGDLLAYLQEKTDGRLTLNWDTLAELSGEEKESLSQQLPEILERTCTSFVQPLAVVDGQMDSADFLSQLEAHLQTIAVNLSSVDGMRSPSEHAAYAVMLKHLLTDRWNDIKAEISAGREEA